MHAPFPWLTYPLQAPPTRVFDTCQREDGLLDIRFAQKIILLIILTVDIVFRGILADPAIVWRGIFVVDVVFRVILVDLAPTFLWGHPNPDTLP